MWDSEEESGPVYSNISKNKSEKDETSPVIYALRIPTRSPEKVQWTRASKQAMKKKRNLLQYL